MIKDDAHYAQFEDVFTYNHCRIIGYCNALGVHIIGVKIWILMDRG